MAASKPPTDEDDPAHVEIAANPAPLASGEKPDVTTEEGVAGSLAPFAGRLLKRKSAAELLGMSVTTFRRRIEDIELQPIIENGVHMFPEIKVTQLAIRYRRERFVEDEAPAADDLGKVTAVVFDLLDQGVPAADIVKQLAKPAPLIEEIHAQWARLRGIVFLTGDEIAKLRSFDWTGCDAPEIHSGERLVMFIRNLHEFHEFEAKNCQGCRAARARLCPACAQIQVERIKAETRRYAEDAKTERAQLAAVRPTSKRGRNGPKDPGDDNGTR